MFNPLEENAKIEQKKAKDVFSLKSEVARVRPSFEPDFVALHKKPRIQKNGTIFTDSNDRPVYDFSNDTYFDLLRLPIDVSANLKKGDNPRKISNNEMKSIRSAIRSTQNESAGKRGRGRKAKINTRKYSTLSHISEWAFKHIASVLDLSIADEYKTRKFITPDELEQNMSEVSDDERPAAPVHRKANVMDDIEEHTAKWEKRIDKFAQKVKIKDVGGVFRVALPVANVGLLDMADSSLSAYSIESYKNIFDNLKQITGINYLNSSATSKEYTLNEFLAVISKDNLNTIPNMKKETLDRYIESVTVRVGPVTQLKADQEITQKIRTITENPEAEGDADFDMEKLSPADKIKYLNYMKKHFNREVTIEINTLLPAEEAEYYVQTSKGSIKSSHLLDFFATVYSHYWLPTVDYIFPVERIEEKNAGYTPAPKSNADGLVTDGGSIFYYIPSVNNLTNFNKVRDEILVDSEGNYTLNPDSNEVPVELKNKLLFTDWVNNKFVYTDVKGKISILDLETMHKIRPHRIVGFLKSSAINLKNFANTPSGIVTFANACDVAYSGSFTRVLMDKINDAEYQDSITDRRMRDYLIGELHIGIGDLIVGLYRAFAYDQMMKDDIAPSSALMNALATKEDDDGKQEAQKIIESTNIIKFLESRFGKILATTLDEFAEKVMSNPQEFIDNAKVNSIPYVLNYLATVVALKNYRYRFDEFVALNKKERAPYLDWDVSTGDPNYEAVLPNVSSDDLPNGERHLKNFQWRALSLLDKSPEFAILAVDAGGGKTITIISNILQELEKNTVTKPLVVCPANLIKDYIQEINFLCAGRVNGVAFTNDVIKDYTSPAILALVKGAPPNTIFITAYDTFVVGRDFNMYGVEPVEDYRHLDLFRQAGFDGVWLDESHKIKNKSARYFALRYAITDIPIKRLATGTLAPNRLEDILNQFGLLDPTVFGGLANFNRLIAATKEGGMPTALVDMLKSHCTFINIKRREWASELPPRIQSFDPLAELTPNQTRLYQILLNAERARLTQDKKFLEKLDKIYEGEGNDDKSDDDDDYDEPSDTPDNEEVEESIIKQFQKHLSHIEMFLSAPSAHPLAHKLVDGEPLLKGDDLKSPKLSVIRHHFLNHMDFIKNGTVWSRDTDGNYITDEHGEKTPDPEFIDDQDNQIITDSSTAENNKILVFTNWQLSVDAIYRDLPAEIKSKTMKYSAKTKVKDFEAFRDNPEMQMMIGIGSSMNTGLNLQFCSRLILLETMWTPGELEQSLARVFRPVKLRFDENGNRLPDPRKYVFINHVIIDKTIDIMKTANLISKWVNVTKALNVDNAPDVQARYNSIPNVDEIRLSLKNLFDTTESAEKLAPHINAFGKMLRAEKYDFDNFKKNNPDKIEVKPLRKGENLPGSAVLTKVPYIPGMRLYNNSDLDVIPYNEWRRTVQVEIGYFNLEEIVAETPIYVHSEAGDGWAVQEGSNKGRKKRVVNEPTDLLTDEADDSDFEDDDSNISSDDLENLTPEMLDSMMQNLDFEDEHDEKDDKSKNVMVRFNYDTSFLSKEEVELLAMYRDDIDVSDLTYTLMINPDKLFVVNSAIESKDVRDAVLESIVGIPNKKKIDITFKPFGQQTDPEKQEKKIKALVEKLKKKHLKEKRRTQTIIEERDKKERVRDEQIKRPRGRPPKVKEEPTVEEEFEVVEETTDERTPVVVNVGQAFGMLALMVESDGLDLREINNYMNSSEFFDIGVYLSVEIPASKLPKAETLLSNLAPTYEDGSVILKDDPIIKNPDTYVPKGKYMVNPVSGKKIDRELFDSGYFVNYKSELPQFNLEEFSYDMLLTMGDSFESWVKARRPYILKGTQNDVNKIKRAYKRKSKSDELRIFTMYHRMSKSKYAMYLAVPTTKNTGGPLAWFKRSTKAGGAALPFSTEPGLFVALYPFGKKTDLTKDLNSLREGFKILNKDYLKEDIAKLKAPRGKV